MVLFVWIIDIIIVVHAEQALILPVSESMLRLTLELINVETVAVVLINRALTVELLIKVS